MILRQIYPSFFLQKLREKFIKQNSTEGPQENLEQQADLFI